jgi:hypothetical protein
MESTIEVTFAGAAVISAVSGLIASRHAISSTVRGLVLTVSQERRSLDSVVGCKVVKSLLTRSVTEGGELLRLCRALSKDSALFSGRRDSLNRIVHKKEPFAASRILAMIVSCSLPGFLVKNGTWASARIATACTSSLVSS